MSLAVHPELLGTAAVIGALVLMIVRQVIAWRLTPQQPAWPWIGITLCGIAFAVTRIVHLSSTGSIGLLMIRAQYAIGWCLPGLGMATVEVLCERPISRATKIALGGALPLALLCTCTPALVRGPLELHYDLFGHPYTGARTGPLVAFVMPIAVGAMVLIRRRASAMPESLTPLRMGFRVGVLLFAVAGLHDSLAGAGVFPSMFVLEYAFVGFGILATNFDLQRNAISQHEMMGRLAEKRLALDEREALLERANQRIDQSTTRYRHLADATREGVVLCAGTRILDMNHALCTMLSTSAAPLREGDLRGAELASFVAEPNRAAFARLVATDDGPLEIGFVRRDGSLIPVSIKAMKPPEGSPGTRTLLVRDISAERELQRRLATADRLAAIGTLAAGTAHEINNPLAFVMANADMLEESTLAPDHREMVEDIKHGAIRIRDIVRDLMSLARDRGGELGSVDVGDVVQRCVAMASPQTRHRSRVVVTCEPKMMPVRANEGRLFQVFLNLIVNAAQAIPEGDVEHNCITITGRCDGEHTIVEVRDTGMGMPPHVLDRVFEAFFTTKEVGHGTGLGLSISHGIVTDLGGRIDVTSEVGVGTTFRVWLPATGERSVEITGPIQIKSAPRLQVLVIEDEVPFARSLARMLDRHDVDIATSGREALEHLARKRYDVALCDVMMPDVTGIQLYTQLERQRDPVTSRFLFMTGGVFSPEAQRFLEEVGPERWMPKPLVIDELRRRVADLGARAATTRSA